MINIITSVNIKNALSLVFSIEKKLTSSLTSSINKSIDSIPNIPCIVWIHFNSFCIFIIGFGSGLTNGIIIYGISCITNAIMPINDIPK